MLLSLFFLSYNFFFTIHLDILVLFFPYLFILGLLEESEKLDRELETYGRKYRRMKFKLKKCKGPKGKERREKETGWIKSPLKALSG